MAPDTTERATPALKDPTLLRQLCYVNGQWVGADDGATNPVTERVATAPGPRSNGVTIAFPLPDEAPQLPLPAPTAHVQVTPVRAAGTVSDKLAAVTVEGPRFVTVTV